MPQFTEIKDGNIPKPYAWEVMKGRNIVVLIVAALMKAATGNIVCVLILQWKTIYISRFEQIVLFSLQVCSFLLCWQMNHCFILTLLN
jgi:hypothetical protein